MNLQDTARGLIGRLGPREAQPEWWIATPSHLITQDVYTARFSPRWDQSKHHRLSINSGKVLNNHPLSCILYILYIWQSTQYSHKVKKFQKLLKLAPRFSKPRVVCQLVCVCHIGPPHPHSQPLSLSNTPLHLTITFTSATSLITCQVNDQARPRRSSRQVLQPWRSCLQVLPKHPAASKKETSQQTRDRRWRTRPHTQIATGRRMAFRAFAQANRDVCRRWGSPVSLKTLNSHMGFLFSRQTVRARPN